MRRRTKRINTTSLIAILLLGIIGFAFLFGYSLNTNPEKQALAIQEASEVLPFKILSKQTGYIIMMFAKVGFFVMLGYVLYYGIAIGRNWLDLKAKQVHAKNGLFPVIELQKGVLYDPNRDNAGVHPIITMGALAVQKQAALKADTITLKQNEALPKVNSEPLMLEQSKLPNMLELKNIANNISLDNLTLGLSDSGVVTASLYDLMHVLAVGASGFGKSAFLRALIWQLAQCQQGFDVVAIDINGSEFNTIQNWNRLLYPVARDTNTAIATLEAVSTELENRKALYEKHPNAFDLPSYNRLSDTQLNPIVLLADEATNLLNQKGIGEPLRAVTQCARQYGIYLLLAGQSAKHSVIDTQVRDNFSTRLCFHTSPSSYRTVLGESVNDVSVKGRAWAQLTGHTMQQIQCPYVTREEVQRVLEVGQPQQIIDVEPVETKILNLHDQGKSLNAIQKEIFGYTGGQAYNQVKAVLQ